MGPAPLVVNLPEQKHTVWSVQQPNALRQLVGCFEQKECFLFDGVHHYRAARRVRDIAVEEQWDVGEEALYPMVHLVNVYDFGVSLGSTHYLVPPVPDFDLNRYVLRTSTFFDVHTYGWGRSRSRAEAQYDFDEDLRIHATNRIAVGVYVPGETQFFLFVLKEGVDRVSVLPPDVSSLYYPFSVVYARRVFAERYYWNQEEGVAPWDTVASASTIDEAVERADREGFGIAFFIYPPTKRNLANLARRGRRLPAGSIRLHPPSIRGLIMDPVSPCLSRANQG
jgi:uncharacterized protein (DUF1015 family)